MQASCPNMKRNLHSEALDDEDVCYTFKRTGACKNTRCRWRHGPPETQAVDSSPNAATDYDAWVLKVQRQIEYYFSDGNLCKDTYLLAKTGVLGTGFVDIEALCSFNRLKQINSDSGLSIPGLVCAAVGMSFDLELSDDRARVRRSRPLPEGAKRPVVGPMLLGFEPNIYALAIDVDDLRLHPHFLALPPPRELEIDGPDTWKWVRQDDPLWDALHQGVLTTRHLKAVLGFHEPRAAQSLRLAQNMVDHGEALSAFRDLLEVPAPSTNSTWSFQPAAAHAGNERRRSAYNARLQNSIAGRKNRAHVHARRRKQRLDIGQIRCAWGSTQEQRALLHLLRASPPGSTMEEIGLCMLDTRQLPVHNNEAPHRSNRWRRGPNHSQASPQVMERGAGLPPLMGASPDAMLRLGDGELAAVEVKSVCPFFMHFGSFAVHEAYVAPEDRSVWPHWRLRGPAEGLRPDHVPQVQWEMFVTDTRQNYFISSSALQGSNVFLIERDDQYIELMLQFIADFYRDFVLTRRPPGTDFFWEKAKYEELLQRTLLICERAAIHQRIPPEEGVNASSLFFDTPKQVLA